LKVKSVLSFRPPDFGDSEPIPLTAVPNIDCRHCNQIAAEFARILGRERVSRGIFAPLTAAAGKKLLRCMTALGNNVAGIRRLNANF